MKKSLDYILLKIYEYGFVMLFILSMSLFPNLGNSSFFIVFTVIYFSVVLIISYNFRKKNNWNEPKIVFNRFLTFFVILLIAIISFLLAIPRDASIGFFYLMFCYFYYINIFQYSY
jgi:hypothetical protein